MTLGAISDDTMSRTRWFKRPWFWVSAISFLVAVAALALSEEIRYVAGMTVVAYTHGITTAKDVEKAAALEEAVTNKTTSIHPFLQNSMSRPDRPPIFITPGSRAIFTLPPVIAIYTITDRGEQDKVIAAVQAVMPDQKLKQVDLQFMDHENWIVHGNIGERGPEL
jgi:hypothetical protein